jgi:3-oxoacyl-[acyl-carrier protein] reductase
LRFDGKVALVTGGGGDIGTATALAFAREGAIVAVADSRPKNAQDTAALIVAEGGKGLALAMDVLDETEVEAAFDSVVASNGAIDILVNLAGDSMIVKSVDCSVEQFDRILRLNVTGQFITARAAARRMISRGRGGSIVNISSIHGLGGIPRRAAYTSSRSAVVNLTRTLAIEWALDGIRVNCVAPSWTMTRALRSDIASGKINLDELIERTPMGRLPEVGDIADVVLFLASDASRMVTGITLPIDGGVTAYVGPGGQPSLA